MHFFRIIQNLILEIKEVLLSIQCKNSRQAIKHHESEWKQENCQAEAVPNDCPNEPKPPANQNEVDGTDQEAALLNVVHINHYSPIYHGNICLLT